MTYIPFVHAAAADSDSRAGPRTRRDPPTRIVRIEMEAPSARAAALETAALALGVQGLEVADETTGGPPGRTCVRLYLPEGAATANALRALRRSLPDVTLRTMDLGAPTEVGVDARASVTRVGRGFCVSTGEAAPRARTRLHIDATLAFGDGVHPTTQLVVARMESHFRSQRPTRVLDVGSGTGVLGLVALSLGAREVVATDVDALARAATKAAARRHGFERRLTVRKTLPRDTFPLVVANLYRDVLLELATPIAARVARRGTLVVSGFGAASRADVVRTFESLGLRHEATRSRAQWGCAAFRRP